jgi:hypothetical protein
MELNKNTDQSKSVKVWIFQANLQRYNIVDAILDRDLDNQVHWLVNQHKKEICVGDIGIIWLSGKDSGIYAITKIIESPKIMSEPEAEKKYWTNDSDKKGEKMRVKMKFTKKLLESHLSKEIIKITDGLANMKILKHPRGTNFFVSSDEWNIIQRLI